MENEKHARFGRGQKVHSVLSYSLIGDVPLCGATNHGYNRVPRSFKARYTDEPVTCQRCLAMIASSPVISQPEDAVTLRTLPIHFNGWDESAFSEIQITDVFEASTGTWFAEVVLLGRFDLNVRLEDIAWAECDEVYDDPDITAARALMAEISVPVDESAVEANIRLTKEVAILRTLVAEQNAAIDELNRKLAAIRNDDMEELVNVVTGRADYYDNDLLSVDSLRAARDGEPFHFGD
jgi:hypothetical protein